MSDSRIEPEVPQANVGGVEGGRTFSRRTVIGAGVAVAGIATMPLPAAADAFSGSMPPSPTSGGTVYTGGNPTVSASNYGYLQDYVDIIWSTSTAGGYGVTGANSPYAGNPVLFNYTIHFGGELIAYGTALGAIGFTWTGPGGQSAAWVSGTPPDPSGRAYNVSPWGSKALDIYVVDTAGERWKIVNWTSGLPTWISY